ncbi:origin recognition complex subunit 6-domain-containing protein [Apodospora peruviana]|uniref:Origin recognition complex subunit 6-domain-containing protein n=1 Tax=Apodospora peruviana TaxID=516989 RepID=A0AAE0HXV1_9PEZI|nr:origin recognition complex subunit 6-domain-containing protein [Apodospora peruviana]
MNRSIEQALLSLLPTHNSTLPQPLTELASSLLAQSRHRASALKAEEEIARPYACAHMACDRLKIALNLPPIDLRPPIPPRIYKRLYNHLEKIMPASTSTPSRATPGGGRKTPSTKLRLNDELASSPAARKAASRVTPSKEKSLAQFRGTPAAAAPTSTKKSSSAASDALPPWMRPTLRFICKELGSTRIGPVVMSAVESVVAPRGTVTDDKWIRSNLVALLGAMYLYVWRAKVVQDEEDAWEGWHTVRAKDLDSAAVHIHRHGWLELDWAKGIDDLINQTAASDGGEGGDDVDEGEQAPLQIRKADTMFQERYDYLSEGRRADYAVWKEGILKRIKELERDTPPPNHDAMEIDGDDSL